VTIKSFQGMQQHVVPEGGQGEQGVAVRVPELRLQAGDSRFTFATLGPMI
jgi:hypothetical protein